MDILHWPYFGKLLFWLVLALFAWLAGRLSTTLLLPGPALPAAQVTQAASIGAPRDLAAQILDAKLFGTKPVKVAKRTVVAKPKASVYGLALHGVIANQADSGFALIASGQTAGLSRLYSLDDELPGGGVLREVRADHVVVDIGVKREKLYLRKLNTVRKAPLSRAAPPARVQRRSTSVSLLHLQQKLRDDPGELSRQVVARPFRKEGKQIGYSVRGLGDKKLMRSLGLRSGDVVTHVNGIALNSDAQALTLYKNALEATSIVAKVIRGGRTIELRRTVR